MGSMLDGRIDALLAELTGADGPLAVTGRPGAAIVRDAPATLGAFLDHHAARHGGKTAFVAGDERIAFTALADAVALAAGALAGRGLAPGERVGIAMRNCPAWIVAYFAILKAGGIATLLNGWWQADELAHALALTTPRLVIADGERAARIAASGWAGTVIVLPVEAPLGLALAPLIDGVTPVALPPVAPEDDATLLFTSGSTGRAKGVVSTHRAVTTAAHAYFTTTSAIARMVAEDGVPHPFPPAALAAVPLFHVTGAVPVLLNSIAIGRKLVLMPRWDAGEALRLIERERITYFVGVPAMSLDLLNHPERDRFDTASLVDVAAGGAARPVAHVPRLKAAFPRAHPMLGYGLTETNAVGATNLRANYLAKPASTGRPPAPFVDIAILDPAGDPVGAGATGEIAIRSAALFRGYWRDPAATAAAFADGWFRTGDLGRRDADGYVFIVDRAKDIIIRGGENIGCNEVEGAIHADPAVAEACVFGLPDDRLGEVPVAVVHARPGARIDGHALAQGLAGRIARFKVPVHIWVSAAPLPRLGTGKIDKARLRRDYAALADGACERKPA